MTVDPWRLSMPGFRPLLVLALLLAPLNAWSQGDDELAEKYYRLGEELYKRADYEGALKEFTQSYEISKRPALLFNMARCHESLGQPEEAIRLYTDYLKSGPSNASVIEARINNLQRLVEKKKPAPIPAPVSPPKPEVVPEKEPSSGSAARKEAPVPVEEGTSPSKPLRLTGWILVGAGGALVATGIILGMKAASKQSELEDANAAGKEYADVKPIEDQGRTYKNAGIGTFVLGAAAAVTGTILLLLEGRSGESKERAWITPGLVPGGGAMMAGGFKF
jgi:tetratricopeptide (TPR) repeat protein